MDRRRLFAFLAGGLALAGLLGDAGAREPALAGKLGVQTQVTAHFTLEHTLGPAGAADLGDLLETLYARYLEACRAAGFRLRAPSESLPWLCTADAQAFSRAVGERAGVMPADEASYYSAQTNAVAMLYRAAGAADGPAAGSALVSTETWRISHEVAHQMCFNTGLQSRGVLYPVWVSEGLAANFETQFPVAGGFAGSNPARSGRLAAAQREGRLRPLDELVVLTSPPTESEACLDVYAQAWGLVHFLFERDPAAFRRYLYTLALRPTGKRPAAALQAEFKSAFGPMAALQREWQDHLARAPAAAPLTAQKG